MSLARVAGLGAVTPVGLSAPATFAALRAGIARLTEIGSFAVAGPGAETQPLLGGRVPLELFDGLPEGERTDYPGHRRFQLRQPAPLASFVDDGPDRLARMLRPAIEEAIADAEWSVSSTGAEVWLAVDPADADEATAFALREACAAAFAAQTLPLVQVSITAGGRAGALANIEAASRALAKTGTHRAIVAGVGSLVRPRDAARLEAFGNLRSADRPLGVHPGECAAAVALERSADRGAGGVVIASAQTAQEGARRGEPSDARALSSALSGALAKAGGASPRPLVVCDLNGDRYRGLEWTLALVRSLGEAHQEGDVWHPAEGIGDAGAGLGALVLAWAANALRAPPRAGGPSQSAATRVLAWGASDDGLRAACVLTSSPSE